jgi:hypothetical protein
MKADIYYPIVEQGPYGNVEKTWVYDRTIVCNFGEYKRHKQEVNTNINVTLEKTLVGRTRSDIRISSNINKESITNVIVTNIRTSTDVPIYVETSGPRAGKSTIYEIESNSPFVGPFGDIEYYHVNIRRAENQATDV